MPDRVFMAGDARVARCCGQNAPGVALAGAGLGVIAHRVASLGLEYGTIVPMHYMNADGWARVVSVANSEPE